MDTSRTNPIRTPDTPEAAQAVVAALDVGKLANIGWWRSGFDGAASGTNLDEMCTILGADLAAGHPVALGFEAPLSVPRLTTAAALGRARPGESKAWSAAAGAAVGMYAVQQVTYVLDRIVATAGPVSATLDPEAWLVGDAQLLVWEAFVSGKAKDPDADNPHIADARSAVVEFQRRSNGSMIASDVASGPGGVVSLAGEALVRCGLTCSTDVLGQAAVVVRSPDR